MSGRAYSVFLLMCLIVGLGLTGWLVEAQARWDAARATVDTVAAAERLAQEADADAAKAAREADQQIQALTAERNTLRAEIARLTAVAVERAQRDQRDQGVLVEAAREMAHRELSSSPLLNDCLTLCAAQSK